MEYHAGDTVMHWMHGVGTVLRLEKRELLGKQSMYYAVKVGEMTVWVPVDEMLTQRLRKPTPKARFKRLVALLAKPGKPLPQDRHERKLLLAQMLRDGRAESLVDVIRCLTAYRHVKALNDNDQASLRRVEAALLGEWEHVLDVTPDNAERQLHRMLEDASA
jgi:RNA polymerase-interacting CarD/CdnL/TRCF family regulator